MTTSGSYDWDMTRDQIITDALSKVGAIDENDTPSTAQITKAARALNGVVKNLSGPTGMPLWAIRQVSFPMTATNTYTIGIGQTISQPKPIKIVQAWILDNLSGFQRPLNIEALYNFNTLGTPASTGQPVQISYSPDNLTGTFYLYPTPDTYSQTNMSIYVRYQRVFQDFDSSVDTADFPQEWYLALVYNLAVVLAPDYGYPPNDRQILKAEAKEFTELAQQAEPESASWTFQPGSAWDGFD